MRTTRRRGNTTGSRRTCGQPDAEATRRAAGAHADDRQTPAPLQALTLTNSLTMEHARWQKLLNASHAAQVDISRLPKPALAPLRTASLDPVYLSGRALTRKLRKCLTRNT
jgi:uncharacterized protein YhdP